MKNFPFVIILLYIAFLSGCTRLIPERDPYTLYLHLTSQPGTLNPVLSSDAYASSINSHIYETLLDMDLDTLELKPSLAHKWEVSKDKLKYRFFLKKGVLWSDGVEFTADDIIYSFKTIMDPKTANAHRKVNYIDIKRVKKIDKYTVEFTYARPYFLALEICSGMTIIPKHIFGKGEDINTHKNNRHPVGTGPYRFARWDTGKKIVLELNERYRDKKPDIKKVVYKLVSESNVALQMLKKGELDIMSIRGIQWIRQTNSDKFIKSFYKLKYYTPSYRYVGWNIRNELFSDKRVRRAMTHLINRKAILNKLSFGLGKIVTGNFYIFGKNYNNKIKPFKYDPDKAKELLKDSGWFDSDGDGILDKNNKKFSFIFTIPAKSKISERFASILKEDLSNIGIQMEIRKFEWAVFIQKLNKREFDAVTLAWSLGFNEDPYSIWHSSQAKEGFNFVGLKNSEADEIIVNARKEFNASRRTKMYKRFHEIIHEEQPYTFLFCSQALVVVNRRFGNVIVHKAGIDFEEWTIKN